MAFKYLVFAAIFTLSYAGEVAVSYSSVNNHHVAHAYAPAVAKVAVPAVHAYAAPALHSYQAPALHSYQAPAVHSYQAPAVHSYHAPAVQTYAAPLVAKVAVAPVVAKYSAPVYAHHHHEEEEHYAPAHYQFEYSVHDPHTHDIKEQKEERKGDVVHGVYSLVEPDGSKRVVEYSADKHSGFNAIVHREHTSHPVAVKTVAPVAYHTAPVVAKYAAPLYHH